VLETTPLPRLRLGVLIWSAGMLGAVAVTVGVLPQLSAKTPLPGPLWLIGLASVAQSALIVALAVWGGVALAPAVGLRAPAFEAAARSRPIVAALAPQLAPGLIAGVLGGPFLFAALRLSPTPIAALQAQFTPPLYARLLYGGITEEVLLRWGFMTVLSWLAWRFVQGRRGALESKLAWVAIVVSAVLFGVGHLPAASFLLGSLTLSIVLFVVGANATFGVLFGWLYRRWGLEAAIVAHATTHLVSYVATGLAG
jgi:membrane protease YdiL (CAAX protease family)